MGGFRDAAPVGGELICLLMQFLGDFGRFGSGASLLSGSQMEPKGFVQKTLISPFHRSVLEFLVNGRKAPLGFPIELPRHVELSEAKVGVSEIPIGEEAKIVALL